MFKMNFCIITLIIFWSSCTETINELPPCNNTDPCAEDACQPQNCIEDTTFVGLDTLWKTDMEGGNIKDMFIDDESIYVNVLTNNSFYIASYSRNTGELNWKYSNELGSISSMVLYNNKIICQRWNTVLCLSTETGNEISNHSIDIARASSTYGYLLENYYYTCMRTSDESEEYLLRSNINDLVSWEVVYTLNRSDVNGSRPNIESTNRWLNPLTQDEILIFQHRMSFPARIDLVAFNLTADSILWWHKDID